MSSESKTQNTISNHGDSDDDDPVVEEFPVYLNHDLTGQLHLFQYQNRPATLPFGDEAVVEAKFRPKNKKLQMVAEIDTKTKFYDTTTGVHMATGRSKIDIIEGVYTVDSQDTEDERDAIMNRQAMEYEPYQLDPLAGYYACLKRRRALHITPITTIGQMRPVFPFIDQNEGETTEGKDAGTESESEAEIEDKGKIQLKFRRDRIKYTPENIEFLSQYYAKHLQNEEQDSWVNLQFSDFDEDVWHQLTTNVNEQATAEEEPAPSEIVIKEEDDDEPMLVDLEPGADPPNSKNRKKLSEAQRTNHDHGERYLRALVCEDPSSKDQTFCSTGTVRRKSWVRGGYPT